MNLEPLEGFFTLVRFLFCVNVWDLPLHCPLTPEQHSVSSTCGSNLFRTQSDLHPDCNNLRCCLDVAKKISESNLGPDVLHNPGTQLVVWRDGTSERRGYSK